MEELERERRALALADRDLAEGRQRILRQEELVAQLDRRHGNAQQAMALLETLRKTQKIWEQHRDLILSRIAYLEAKELPRR